MIQKIVLIIIIFLSLTSVVHSDLEFDGTMNPAFKGKTLGGEIMEIKPEHGKIVEKNLFHSFRTFNVEKHQIANFTGPEKGNIQNIISRVTGGELSSINGTIKSEISNANFYLLNPAGVIFGSHASLDVKGSFHVSTVDYLIMQDNIKYDIHSTTPTLSMANPKAFGFIDDAIGSITIRNEDNRANAYIHFIN